MENLPALFDQKGVFIEPSAEVLGQLDDATRARLDAVRSTYDALQRVEADEKAATDEVANAVQALDDAEAYRKKHHPPATFQDEWMANFGRPDQQRRYAAQKAKARNG